MLPPRRSSFALTSTIASQANALNAVTELNAATGALVQTIVGSRYGFNVPTAVCSDGTDVWVTNPGDQSVTGFPSSTG